MSEQDDTAPSVGDGYDALAKQADELSLAASPWGDSHFQRHYSWPATRAALPALADRRVLLAGCGRGDHVGHYLDGGATVVGLDASERAVRTAPDRWPDAAFDRGDLTEPLDYESGSFDLVVSNLVLSHVEEWRPVFEEFRRVLTDDGRLVFSTVHPQYLRSKWDLDRYDERQQRTVSWPDAELPTYYRPMSDVVESLVSTGFRIESFDEPTPLDSYREVNLDRYEDAMKAPEVLVVGARCE